MDSENLNPVHDAEAISDAAQDAVESVQHSTEQAITDLATAMRIHGEAHSTALGRIETQLTNLANSVTNVLESAGKAATEVVATPAEVIAGAPGVAGETVGATVENVSEEPKKIQ